MVTTGRGIRAASFLWIHPAARKAAFYFIIFNKNSVFEKIGAAPIAFRDMIYAEKGRQLVWKTLDGLTDEKRKYG